MGKRSNKNKDTLVTIELPCQRTQELGEKSVLVKDPVVDLQICRPEISYIKLLKPILCHW